MSLLKHTTLTRLHSSKNSCSKWRLTTRYKIRTLLAPQWLMLPNFNKFIILQTTRIARKRLYMLHTQLLCADKSALPNNLSMRTMFIAYTTRTKKHTKNKQTSASKPHKSHQQRDWLLHAQRSSLAIHRGLKYMFSIEFQCMLSADSRCVRRRV